MFTFCILASIVPITVIVIAVSIAIAIVIVFRRIGCKSCMQIAFFRRSQFTSTTPLLKGA